MSSRSSASPLKKCGHLGGPPGESGIPWGTPWRVWGSPGRERGPQSPAGPGWAPDLLRCPNPAAAALPAATADLAWNQRAPREPGHLRNRGRQQNGPVWAPSFTGFVPQRQETQSVRRMGFVLDSAAGTETQDAGLSRERQKAARTHRSGEAPGRRSPWLSLVIVPDVQH